MLFVDKDPYTRIVHEYEDGTIRVCLRISKEVYLDLIDIVDYLGLNTIEEGFKLAVESLQEKIFDKKALMKIKRPRKKVRKITVESRELREIKNMISFITKMINNISNNIARAERVSSIISTQSAPITGTRSETRVDIDLGELKVSASPGKKPKEPEKSLEDAIEDVLVVAIADEILKK